MTEIMSDAEGVRTIKVQSWYENGIQETFLVCGPSSAEIIRLSNEMPPQKYLLDPDTMDEIAAEWQSYRAVQRLRAQERQWELNKLERDARALIADKPYLSLELKKYGTGEDAQFDLLRNHACLFVSCEAEDVLNAVEQEVQKLDALEAMIAEANALAKQIPEFTITTHGEGYNREWEMYFPSWISSRWVNNPNALLEHMKEYAKNWQERQQHEQSAQA